ncbi:AbrB/MazE/SpoVT family DNA-binding domain-containing protein [Candidatus Gottesmanbacteria bacterium]|nr:AbrB/MazE/SpoVT family DNA-binding domain-containing protein [Candidatus Gottesmanbacteria bacterium]
MQTYTVSITSQGQISIPADLRRALGLHKKTKAIVRADEGKMVVEPVPDILDFKGIFKVKKTASRQEERRAFEEALARGEV